MRIKRRLPDMSERNAKAMRQGMIWGVGGKFLLMLANLITLMVTSRILGAEEFGIYAMSLVFADFCIGFANSTLGTVLVTRKDLDDDGLKAGFISFLVLSIFLAAVIILGADQWSALVGLPEMAPVLSVVTLILPLRFMSSYLGSVLMRQMELKTHQISQSFPQLLGAVTTISGALLGLGVWCLVVGILTASIAEFAFLLKRTKAPFGLPSGVAPVIGLFKSGAGLSVARIISFFASNVDRVIIGRQMGAGALGLYTRGYGLMMVPFKLFGVTFGRVFLSAFSQIKPDDIQFGALMSRILAVQGFVYIPVSIGLILSTDILVQIVLGAKWVAAVPLAQCLFAAMFARMGYEVCENILFAAEKAWIVAQRQVLLFVLLLAFGLSGYHMAELVGVSAGISAALIVYYILSLIQLIRMFDGDAGSVTRGHLAGIAVSIVSVAVTFTVWQLVTGGVIPDGAFGKTVWTGLYWVIMVVALGLTPATVCGQGVADFRTDMMRRVLRKKSKSPPAGEI